MSDDPRKLMEQAQARLLEEAAAIARDLAEYDRITAKYKGPPGTQPGSEPSPAAAETAVEFDGTVNGLIHGYTHHPDSQFQKVHYATRASYEHALRPVKRELGSERVEDLNRERLDRVWAKWSEGGHLVMARANVGALRRLATFGSTVLKDRACIELRVALHDMRIPTVEPRVAIELTAAQATLIRKLAHLKGRHSIALAQAFQHDCPSLGQKDVVGEWVSVNATAAPLSDVIDKGRKWLRGLRWNEIDQHWILRHPSGGEIVEIDLRDKQMVREELERLGVLPRTGPVIVNDKCNIPYTQAQFRTLWRRFADDADVPKEVKYRDSGADEESPVPHRRQRGSAR
jgi:hypothetical protein